MDTKLWLVYFIDANTVNVKLFGQWYSGSIIVSRLMITMSLLLGDTMKKGRKSPQIKKVKLPFL